MIRLSNENKSDEPMESIKNNEGYAVTREVFGLLHVRIHPRTSNVEEIQLGDLWLRIGSGGFGLRETHLLSEQGLQSR